MTQDELVSDLSDLQRELQLTLETLVGAPSSITDGLMLQLQCLQLVAALARVSNPMVLEFFRVQASPSVG